MASTQVIPKDLYALLWYQNYIAVLWNQGRQLSGKHEHSLDWVYLLQARIHFQGTICGLVSRFRLWWCWERGLECRFKLGADLQVEVRILQGMLQSPQALTALTDYLPDIMPIILEYQSSKYTQVLNISFALSPGISWLCLRMRW